MASQPSQAAKSKDASKNKDQHESSVHDGRRSSSTEKTQVFTAKKDTSSRNPPSKTNKSPHVPKRDLTEYPRTRTVVAKQSQNSSAEKSFDSQRNDDSDPPVVKETRHVSIDYNPVSGRKTLNTYEIIKELGRGEHGRVKLGFDIDKRFYVAIKLINRKEKPRLGRPQGSSKLEKIHREIAILKKCAHPNIVQLLEVLDDEKSRKIYLVLEYCRKGEIRWQLDDGSPALTREQARSVARDVALGLEYLHMNNVIHRDIKPANLLVADDNVVKISDFGVSYLITHESGPAAELELAKTVGTPAFFSPELCIPIETRENGERKLPPISAKVDVWAFGVTLFCLLTGCLPFEADNEYELFRVIANSSVTFPDATKDPDLAQANNLLAKLLTKDPILRPSIAQIKNHPWLLKELSKSQTDDFLYNINKGAIEVSPEEVDQAVKGVSIKTRIKQSLTRFAEQMKPHSKSRTKLSDGLASNPEKLGNLKLDTNAVEFPAVENSQPRTLTTSPLRRDAHSSHTHHPNSPQGIHPDSIMHGLYGSTSSSANTSANTSINGFTHPHEYSHIDHSVDSRQESLSSLSDGMILDASSGLTTFPTLSEQHSTPSPMANKFGQGSGVPSSAATARAPRINTRDATTLGLMPMDVANDDSSLTSDSKRNDNVQAYSELRVELRAHELTSAAAQREALENGHGKITYSQDGSLHRDELPTHYASRLPELEIPRLDSDSFWEGPGSDSSSSEDDSGELTLVVGRDRTRSIERGSVGANAINMGGSNSRRGQSSLSPHP